MGRKVSGHATDAGKEPKGIAMKAKSERSSAGQRWSCAAAGKGSTAEEEHPWQLNGRALITRPGNAWHR